MVHRSLWSFGIILTILFIFSSSIGFVHALDNLIRTSKDFNSDIELFNNTGRVERRIFDYRKNGVRLDIRLVSGVNNSNSEEEDDRFPMPPIRDLGHCLMDLSTICIKNRIARYIDTVGRLDKITLFGSTVKFVKVREPPKKKFSFRAMDSVGKIDRSIDDFFDKFALRITLPGWNKRKEQNQIDFMFDDTDLVEGRGKGGGGGGGGKGGGKCKQMMMCMMMALKMKLAGMMGLMMVKGLMMAGASMMMTKAMLLMKLMKLKGGGGGGGGGGDHGGQLKEIVLLTKASGGGGGGGGGGYGPPPPSSYGAPPISAGSGGYAGGGGGGWGRSFDKRLPMTTSANIYPESDNTKQSSDNFSIINTYPELNRSNYLRSIDNQENIGEVYQHGEPDSEENYSQIDNGNKDKLLNVENTLGNDYDSTSIVYANYWKNYEAADKIWDTKGPIVATKTFSPEKLN